MNLIVRYLRFLALLAFNLLLSLIWAIFRLIFLPVLLVVLRVLRDLIFLSFIAAVNGPVQYTDHLASEWTRPLLELGGPRDHIDQIFVFCQLAVSSLVALGWIVTALFTVEILRVIYGWFFI